MQTSDFVVYRKLRLFLFPYFHYIKVTYFFQIFVLFYGFIIHGKSSLSKSSVWVYKKRYDEILQTAYEENPLPQTEKGKRGKPKKGKVLSLIDRLRKYKGAVCLFLENLFVPFDNNQAERDIRNIKVKTKVSGCFRSMEGATEYLTLMSYVGTARKHGINSFKAIKLAVLGTPKSIFQ